MNSPKIFSVIISTAACLFLVMLIHPGFYRLLFGVPGEEFAKNISGMISCCVSMGVYPLSGIIYTLRERKSDASPWSFLIGGAISGFLVFFLFILLSFSLPPGGLTESINQAIEDLYINFPDRVLFGVVGSMIGLGMAFLMMAAMGGTAALFLSFILIKRND